MPAAAARERSRTIPSSTACNWSKAPTKPARWPGTCWASRWSPFKPAPKGRPCARCWSKRAATSPASCTWASSSIGPRGPVLMVSSEGGMDIEDVAAKTPELIFRERFDPDAGLQVSRPASWRHAGASRATVRSAETFMKGCAGCSSHAIAAWLEINPLVVTGRRVLALDAKMTFDDNAMFRHKDLAELRDLAEEEPAEVRAGKAGLSYVKLDGNIGCLVNGAGLAMSTMDLIKLHGGEPANFLDVGGGANVDQVTEAFRILLADKNVQGRAGQHLRRHHAVHHDRHGHARGLQDRSASASRWSCGWKEPKSNKVARCWPTATGHHRRRRLDRRGQESRRRRGAGPACGTTC